MAVRGWVFDKRNGFRPYRAHIFINGQYKFLGNFATPEEANAAYHLAREQHPRNSRRGGNSGFRYPRIRCEICLCDFSERHYKRHIDLCQKKYPSGFEGDDVS